MAAQLPDFSALIAGVPAAMQAIQTWIAFRDRKRAAEVYDDTFEQALSDIAVAEESSLIASIIPMHSCKNMGNDSASNSGVDASIS